METDNQSTSTQAPATITKDEALTLAQQAAQAAVDEFKKSNPGLTPQQVQEAILADRKHLAASILGQTDKKDKDPVKELLETDPSAAFAIFADTLREKIETSVTSRLQSEKQAEAELKQAAAEVLSDRPDITDNKQLTTLLNQFYAATSDALSEKDRIKEAVKQVDLLLESTGLGDRESRVKKATSLRSSPTGAQGPSGERLSHEEREKKVFSEWRDERLARYNAIRGTD